MRTTSLLLALLTLAACDETTPPPLDDAGGQAAPFDTPESALWDAARGVWYVSNIAGESDAADGRGWIARLDPDGRPLDARWVDGLDAPKGLGLAGDRLFVADLTALVVVDVTTAAVERTIELPGAVFLNDVAIGDGVVYVSDSFGAAIYTVSLPDLEVGELARGPALASVNGLFVDGDRLLAGTIGDFMDPTDLGATLAVSLDGEVQTLATEVGKLDGIERDGDAFLATDFRGALLRLAADGHAEPLVDLVADYGMASAADLGFDPARRVAAVPDLFASRVVFVEVP